MKIYASSDTHYFHDNIIKYCDRPFRDVGHMNREMMQRWNDVVKPGDIALHVGDISAGLKGRDGDLRDIISGLHGTKILVRGNHDHLPDSWYLNAGFSVVVPHLFISGYLFVHYPIEEAVKRFPNEGWGPVTKVIHGHIHRADVDDFDDHYNVAVDRNGFFPVSLEWALGTEVPGALVEGVEKIVKTLP